MSNFIWLFQIIYLVLTEKVFFYKNCESVGQIPAAAGTHEYQLGLDWEKGWKGPPSQNYYSVYG